MLGRLQAQRPLGLTHGLLNTGHHAALQGSEKVYAEECAASPCFAINFTQPSSRRTSYEEFRKLNSKWQHKLGKVGVPHTLFTTC